MAVDDITTNVLAFLEAVGACLRGVVEDGGTDALLQLTSSMQAYQVESQLQHAFKPPRKGPPTIRHHSHTCDGCEVWIYF